MRNRKRTRAGVILSEAVLVDEALVEINEMMIVQLAWLDEVYGKCERRKEIREGQVLMIPSIPAGGEQYVDLFPDNHIGNFSFFDIQDGEDISNMMRGNGQIKINFGLVFWFDLRTIFPDDWGERNSDNVKKLVYDFFNQKSFLKSKTRLIRSYVREENVYKGYSVKEVDNQFYMRPYGGFRVEGEMIVELKNLC